MARRKLTADATGTAELDPILERVADLLNAYPMTPYAIAKMAGVKPDTVMKIKARENGVRSSILSRILDALGYDFEIKKRKAEK